MVAHQTAQCDAHNTATVQGTDQRGSDVVPVQKAVKDADDADAYEFPIHPRHPDVSAHSRTYVVSQYAVSVLARPAVQVTDACTDYVA